MMSSVCNKQNFMHLTAPPIVNRDKHLSQANNCNIVFLLDLGKDFTDEEQYSIIQIFMFLTVKNCIDRGIGYTIKAYNMFDPKENVTCCSEQMCWQEFAFMPYDTYVTPYTSKDPVVKDEPETNFSIQIIEDLKLVKPGCLYNHAIMISNRIFDADQKDVLNWNIPDVTNYACITFSVIVVGRAAEISQADLDAYYGNYTKDLFVVPDYNCILNLDNCIGQCASTPRSECLERNFTHCPLPTPPPDPTTTTVPSTTTMDPTLAKDWHIIYIFALTNRTTADDFPHVVKYIGDPIQACADRHLVIRFLSPKGGDSGWVTELKDVETYLATLRFDEITINTAAPEIYDNDTMEMINRALSLPVTEDTSIEGPRITLVTDFASRDFLDDYKNNTDNILLRFELFDFQLIAFDSETVDLYKERKFFPSKNLHQNPTYNDSFPWLPLCHFPPTPTPAPPNTLQTVIIVVGSCIGFMIILILATCVFRQKYMIMERWMHFKRDFNEGSGHRSAGDDDDDIIDYWEVGWDDVIVKNDRLGWGAHGQVYKGKVRGSLPGVEHYFRPEDRVNYVNCEVAVKMLPATASDKAKEEFLAEIDLMKSFGYNQNIVNMLGCITSHKRLGLVLEYCAQGDLLRYLKRKKAELEETRSMDNQIDCTREFMQFGWQVAHGMEFLQQENIIHRDLAARNVLIDRWGNAKVADFGLCMRLGNSGSGVGSVPNSPTSPTSNGGIASIAEGGGGAAGAAANGEGRLPIKWLAIECLQRQQFSFKSDVWSFGIVLYEMHTMGEAPFADVEASDLLNHLLDGHRPPKPLIASEKMYEVMCRCWDELPEKRPSFGELLTIFTIFIEQATEGYGYLQLIKSSEHYKALPAVAQAIESDKERNGQAEGEEAKEKPTRLPWKKLATTLKMRSVFSHADAPSTPAPAAAPAATPKLTPKLEERAVIEKTKAAENALSKWKRKEKDPSSAKKDRWDMLSSNLGIDRLRRATGGGNTDEIERSPTVAVEKETPSATPIPPRKQTQKLDFLSTAVSATELPNCSSISIDGHAVKQPVYYPRKPQVEVSLPISSPFSSSTESLAEAENGFLGRYSFHRGSAIKRHQSCPGRKSIDGSIDSHPSSRKMSRLSRELI